MEFIPDPTSFGLLPCLISHTGCPRYPPAFVSMHLRIPGSPLTCLSKLLLVFSPISTFSYPGHPCFLRDHFFVQPHLPSGAQGASVFQISDSLPRSVPLVVLSHLSALIPCSTLFSPGKTCSEAGTSKEQARADVPAWESLGHLYSLTHILGSAVLCSEAICHL